MPITLTIDRGNGSVKTAIWDGERLLSRLVVDDLADERLADAINSCRPDGCIYSTVCDDAAAIEGMLAGKVGKVMHLTASTPLPIAIGYSTPLTLGADRIAAATAAYMDSPGRQVLVVDIGTAVTYDVVSANGRFLGGNIAPGVGMRLRALHSFTARLPLVESRGPVPPFGCDTATAMRTGAVRGVLAEIAYYRGQLPADSRVVLTGGWAEDIAALANFPVEVDKLLVLKGLNRIYLYNENI